MVLLVVTEDAVLSAAMLEYSKIQRIFQKIYTTQDIEDAKNFAHEHAVSVFAVDESVEQGQGRAFIESIKSEEAYKLAWTIMLAEGAEDCSGVIGDYNSGLINRCLMKPVASNVLIEMIEDLASKKIVSVSECNRLRVRRKSVDYFFDYDEIVFIETVEKMAYIYTVNSKHKIGRVTLSELEERLNQERFVRVHRSYIVNTDYIDQISKHNNQNLIKIKHYDNTVPVGRTYKQILGLV